jgi:hypothetical protein
VGAVVVLDRVFDVPVVETVVPVEDFPLEVVE